MMQKIQGLASYGYGAFIEKDDEKEKFERDTRFLMNVFNSLQDYAALIVNDHSSGKISEAPGCDKYKYLLSSEKEVLFYTHTEEMDAKVSGGESLKLCKLDLPDGSVCIRIVKPHDQSMVNRAGKIRNRTLDIALPSFFEDIAMHVEPIE